MEAAELETAATGKCPREFQDLKRPEIALLKGHWEEAAELETAATGKCPREFQDAERPEIALLKGHWEGLRNWNGGISG